ncbi:MAG: NUDIX hydrolase [Thermoplasmata archaeon]
MSAGKAISDVLARLSLGDTVPREAAKAAAIAVLRERDGEVEVLLIQRTERVDDPASGHIALPGGRVDPGDATLLATALRECEEEVGLRRSDLVGTPRFAGIGGAFQSRLPVGVFAARLGEGARLAHAASPEEVAGVFWLPRSTLLPARSVPRRTSDGVRPVEATVYDGRVLWGFTRRALLDLFELEPSGPYSLVPAAQS